MILKSLFILLFYCYIGGAQGFVRLQSSGPTVLGANLTLSASITFTFPGAEFKYVFRSVENEQFVEIFSSESVVNHTVKISRDKYDVGLYAFEVRVYRKISKYRRRPYSLVGRDRLRVSITDLLNGKLKLIQNGFDRSYGRIFAKEQVNHVIELSDEEQQFLTDDNTYIVHWYIDCSLISSTGLYFDYTYENKYQTYNLEALVEVAHSRFSNSTSNSIPEGLSGFKCTPVYSSGYTYGYYKASVRTDATDGSPPPPIQATSGKPSNFLDTTSERAVYHSGGDEGHVKLESSGPTVRGAYLTLLAKFVDGYPGVERKYVFRNVEKQVDVEIFSKESVVNYTLKLHKTRYEPGSYRFEVRAYERNQDDPDTFRYLSKDAIRVTVTDLLNGKLKMIQTGSDRSHGRIFPNEQVSLLIELSQEEQKFLTDGNTYLVHWYLDCSLISSTGLHLNYTYEERYKNYVLEALVEVEHNIYSAAARVISKGEKLKGFKCAPVHNAGYTYGYYKINVRTDATDGSPPPPSATSEIPSSTWQDSGVLDWDSGSIVNNSPAPNSVNDPWRNWRTTESYTNAFDSGDHKNCTSNANNAVISIKDGHMKIAMDLVFHGTVNITNFQIERN